MDKFTVVAPVGKEINNIFIGIRDFPTAKLILLTPANKVRAAHKIAKQVDKFKIPVKLVEIGGNIWESLFKKISQITKVEGEKKLLINTASADRSSQCALTSAAFVNGIRAFAVENGDTMLLPILKFSYYKLLTDKKMSILKLLYQDKTCCASLEELSKKTKMSLPLISYHINGTLKSEGLKKLGLVDTIESGGKISVNLSTMGQLLIKGYVPVC
tara:strand:- start:8693 stop:9337 length:645 start_codon:yes stop_codon:yes gene_type:complete